MKLLLMHEWSGPMRSGIMASAEMDQMNVKERQVAFITGLPLGKAMARIRLYEDAFKARYGHASRVYEFKLLAVSELGPMSVQQVELTRADCVERLAQRVEDFG